MLLEPGKIGDLELPNRIMLSPHGSDTGGERGEVTDELVAYHQRRAEGGDAFIPEVPGVKGEKVATFLDVVANEAEIGERVVVAGANTIGCEVALLLA